MRRHISILFVLACVTVAPLLAQSTWQGNAVVGGFGEFPDEGFYAASNSFPQNQVVEVTNLETGSTVSVIVAKRVDQPGIFLVLSGDAARELGVERGEPARVEARPTAGTAGAGRPGSERALSQDPDVNPSAALTEEELYPEPEPEPEPEPRPEPEPDVDAAVIAGGTVEPRRGVAGGVGSTAQRLADPRRAPRIGRAEAPAPAPAPEPGPEPAAAPETNEVEQAVTALRDRFPQKDRFPPPRENGVATFLTPPPRAEEELELDGRIARVPDPPAEVAEETPAAEYLGRLAPPIEEVPADLPGASEPAEIAEEQPEESLPPAVKPEDEMRAEVPEDAVVTLKPAEARPPEKPAEPEPEPEPAPEPEPEPEPAAEELPVVTALEGSRYYLQVGAYSNAGRARAAVNELGATYPTEVLAAGSEVQPLYRVLVGPLREDERGSVLYFVRAMGYRDAFIRQAEG